MIDAHAACIYIYILFEVGLSGGSLLLFFFLSILQTYDGCLVGSGVWLSVFNSRMWFEVAEHLRKRIMGYLFVACLMSYVRRISGLSAFVLVFTSQVHTVSTRISGY